MNRKKLASIIIMVSIAFLSISCTKEIVKPQKQILKPTEEGAKKLAEKYWKLNYEAKYSEMYDLLSPKDMKLVSKEKYIESMKKRDEESLIPKVMPKITAVAVEGNLAKASLSYDTPFGKVTQDDTIIFVNGNWYQRLETDSLMEFGVPLAKLPDIKKANFNEQISVPAFDAIVHKVEVNKTMTDEYGTRETAKGKYIILEISIINTGKQPFRFSPEKYLNLSDNRDRIFNLAEFAPGTMTAPEIIASMTEKGLVAFDIPEDAQGLQLLIDKRYLVDLGI